MRTFLRIALCLFVASLAASILASVLFGAREALCYDLPALLLAAWAALGHLVRIDDDAEGGWSNPNGSSQI
jgi:hypothetical protein